MPLRLSNIFGRIDMQNVRRKLDYILHLQARGVPLYIVFLCGLAGICIDLDHVVSYWLTGVAHRAAHIPLAVVSVLILCGVGAYLGRLYYKHILKKGVK